MSGSGSGSGSDPDFRSRSDGLRDPGAPTRARAVDVPPSHPALGTDGTLSVSDVQRLFGETRHKTLGGHLFQSHGLGIDTKKLREAAEIIAATRGAAQYVEESMRRFWAQVKAGTADDAELLKARASMAFAYWIKRFIPGDFEEMSGVAPKIGKPDAKAKPAHLREMPE